MSEIIPSVIAKNFEEVKEKISQLDDFVSWAQLDISDGIFASPQGWGNADDLENLSGKIKVEAHLMVEKPEDVLKQWMSLADRVLIHLESTDYLADIIESFDGAPNRLGIVLKSDTPVETLEDFVGKVDYIQLMSVTTLGSYGGRFDDNIFERLKITRAIFPNVIISVDGGVNLDNAVHLIESGANHLVVGSAIWESSDPIKTIKQFQSLI